jgi:hypothetical protein
MGCLAVAVLAGAGYFLLGPLGAIIFLLGGLLVASKAG